MKERFIMMHFGLDAEAHYIKETKEHWWSRWEVVMDGPHPILFRRRGNDFIPF